MTPNDIRSTLLGVPFDGGIRMMRRFGRGCSGAAAGPAAILSQRDEHGNDDKDKDKVETLLLDLEQYTINVTEANRNDPAAIQRDNETIHAAHNAISTAIQQINASHLPISLGGDHSITYPLVQGFCRARPGKKYGLIYLDAHLDLRPLETHAGVSGLLSSGNPFRRIIDDTTIPIEPKNMVAIGIHRTSTPIFHEMERYATEQGMRIFYDTECQTDRNRTGDANHETSPSFLQEALDIACDGTDGIYLSLDIDAVEARHAPGVSAPASIGLSRNQWLGWIQNIIATRKVVGADLVEVSSREQTKVDSITVALANETVDLLLLG